MLKSYQEYIDQQGKTVEKAVVDPKADYKGTVPVSPEEANTSRVKAPKAAGKPSPYVGKGTDPGLQKTEKGLMDTGDKKLVYEPDTEVKTTEIKTWPSQKEFVNHTSKMNIKEFVQYMIKEGGCGADLGEQMGLPTVTAWAAGDYHPHPPQALKYVVALIAKNEGLMASFIQELKKENAVEPLLKHLFSDQDSYDGLSSLMSDPEDGGGKAKMLVKAMNNGYQKHMDDMYGDEGGDVDESVGPPFGVDDVPYDDETDEEPKDVSPDESEDGQPEDEPHDTPDSPEDDDNCPDCHKDEEKPEPSHKEPRKMKRRFAHDHLIDAMKGVDHMAAKMRA